MAHVRSYKVTLTTKDIDFDSDDDVEGKQPAKVNANAVRRLAQKFIDADFYSMDNTYDRHVVDSPWYSLTISIDGRTKRVEDHDGPLEGMPEVVRELEDDVDALAGTSRLTGKGVF